MRTPIEKTLTYKTIADSEEEDSPLSDTAKNSQSSVSRGTLPVKRSEPFQKEQARLVDEVRKGLLINMLVKL